MRLWRDHKRTPFVPGVRTWFVGRMNTLPLRPDPALDLPPPPLPKPRRGRLGWGGHLFLLSAWLVSLILLGRLREASGRHVAFHSVRGVVWSVGIDTLLFGTVCGLAWWCSRATAAEWRLRWRGGFGPVWRGVLYSVAIRVAMFVMLFAVVMGLIALHVIDSHALSRFRPQIENAVSLEALTHDRAFFWCMVTLLSASAGILEEIWRGGMLAGLAGTFPRAFGGPVGQWTAILPVAVLFGCGHLYMGWPAAVAATGIGLLLGAITVWHRTIWDAAIAHALFDASTLAALAWMLHRNPHLLGQ